MTTIQVPPIDDVPNGEAIARHLADYFVPADWWDIDGACDALDVPFIEGEGAHMAIRREARYLRELALEAANDAADAHRRGDYR